MKGAAPPGPEKTKGAAPDQENAPSKTAVLSHHTARNAENATPNLPSQRDVAGAQATRVLALLKQGPKSTIDLRQHGILMPGARIHQLRNERNLNIVSEMVSLYDAHGYLHSNVARYRLVLDKDAGGKP